MHDAENASITCSDSGDTWRTTTVRNTGKGREMKAKTKSTRAKKGWVNRKKKGSYPFGPRKEIPENGYDEQGRARGEMRKKIESQSEDLDAKARRTARHAAVCSV